MVCQSVDTVPPMVSQSVLLVYSVDSRHSFDEALARLDDTQGHQDPRCIVKRLTMGSTVSTVTDHSAAL